MVRISRSETPFGYSPIFFLKIKLSSLIAKRLFLPFCEKEGQCGGNGWTETKSHVKVRSKEMLIQKDEKFRKEWEKKGPRDPPTHKITRESQCTFQREEGSGAELVEICCDKQPLLSLGPAESPSAGPSADTSPATPVTPWTSVPGTEPEEGTALPSSSSCVALRTSQARGLCVSWLDGVIWKLTKAFCPHNSQRDYCFTDGF